MVIRGFALLLLVLTLLGWGYLGSNLGWTKTSVATTRTDPITDISYTEYESRFVPGVEFLAIGIAGAVVIFAATLFIPLTKPKSKSS